MLRKLDFLRFIPTISSLLYFIMRKNQLPIASGPLADRSNIRFHGVKLTDKQKCVCIIFIENRNIKKISVNGGIKPFIQLIILKKV